MSKIIEKKLIEEFKDREFFTREELFDFFRYFEPDLKEGTFGWRIYDLKNKKIIRSLKRGLYTISYKPKYKPQISDELIKFSKKINGQFSEIKFCLWDTQWLNEFARHQSGKQIQIIEIEKDFVKSLYYYLKDQFKFDFYLSPDEKIIDFYISESNNPIVIKKLITRSPIGKITEKKVKLMVPLLEKILVDLYSDEKLFYFYHGAELKYIFENAITNYTLNFTRLYNYAGRREKEAEIKTYLKKNMGHLLKDIIDD